MSFVKGIRNTWKVLFQLFSILSILKNVSAVEDDYLTEAQSTCYETHDTYSCFKFRSLRYMSGIASGAVWPQSTNESARHIDMRLFNLVPIKNYQVPTEHEEGSFFGDSRQMKSDSEFDKFIKFAKRQLELYMSSHGITFGLPDGATTIPYEEYSSNEIARSNKDGRGKKKKLAMLLPLLSLFSIFKVKLLLVPILLTVLFIKKILVLAVLFLPSILSTLKICKMQNMTSGHHGQWASAEGTQDYSSGYGNGYPASYGSGGQAGYNKDWGTNRAYSGYKTTYDQNAAYKTIGDMASHAAPNSNVMYNAQ